jgi:hypothetical protein
VTTKRYIAALCVWTTGAGVALIVSLLVTNPVSIGPVGVTVWFIVLLGEAAAAATLVLYGVKTYLHLHATEALRLRYSWRQGWLIGGWATSLLALNSLQQLGIKDAILLGLLLLIVEVYVRLRWP